MSYKDEVIAFLSQPENLEIALEVSDYIKELRINVHKKFWVMFTRKIQDRLANSAYRGQWRFQPLPKDKWSTQLGKCYLVPDQAGKIDKSLLQFAVGQGHTHNFFQLYRGVCWIGDAPKQDLHRMKELEFFLKEKDLTKTDKNWPGYSWLPYRIQSNKFIIQFQNNPEEAIDLIVTEIMQLFEELRPLLEEINSNISA